MPLLKSRVILRNIMLAGNTAVGLYGLAVFFAIKEFGVALAPDRVAPNLFHIHLVCFGMVFLVQAGATVYYEAPLRLFLSRGQNIEDTDDGVLLVCRKRILNEPFFLLLLDMGAWTLAALLHGLFFYFYGVTVTFLIRISCQIILIGVVTTAMAFFVLEWILTACLVHTFFPRGGLHKTPGTFRIKISTRLIALFIGISFIPLTAFFLMSMSTRSSPLPAEALIDLYRTAIEYNTAGFLLEGIILVWLVGTSLTRPFSDIIRQLSRISSGEFAGRIPVSTNDEIGYTSEIINEMTEGLMERELIKDAFGRYVSEDIRDAVLSGSIPLDGEQKEVTVLFADLANFTPLIENHDPKQSVAMMNRYFSQMEQAVKANNGLVLQFIGDEIYAVFGAPVADENHPANAVKAALEMEHNLAALNRQFEAEGLPAFSHRIGLHSGSALAANMGSPDRMSYLLVGNTVNIAARLQELNKTFGTRIIISGKMFEKLLPDARAAIKSVSLGQAPVKGIKDPIAVYSITAIP